MFPIQELLKQKRVEVEARIERRKQLESLLILLDEEITSASEVLRKIGLDIQIGNLKWDNRLNEDFSFVEFSTWVVPPVCSKQNYTPIRLALGFSGGQFLLFKAPEALYLTQRQAVAKGGAGDVLEATIGLLQTGLNADVSKFVDAVVEAHMTKQRAVI